MIRVYSVPEGENILNDLEVTANGLFVPVLGCDVSAIPYNRRWPGHQRQKEQTEKAYFIRFCADEAVTLSVKVNKAFSKTEVRPLDKHVSCQTKGQTVTFTLPSAGGYTFEADGWHHALHIFFDTPKLYPGKYTYSYGPGIHHVGTITLHSDESLYIDEGAIVYGRVDAIGADRCRICGKGILDNSEEKEKILFEMETLGDGSLDVKNAERLHCIEIQNSNDCLIEGITIRNSLLYNVNAHGCNGLVVDNIKAIGDWRYNSDGVDLHNCCHCVVKNCFLRTFDDSICVKGHPGYQEICDDIVVDNCVVWNDWDHTLEIGAETCAKEMKNIVFRNCYVIHAVDTALSIANVDYGHVHHVTYENISVEGDEEQLQTQLQKDDEMPYTGVKDYRYNFIGAYIAHHYEYSVGNIPGRISDITYRNIRVYGVRPPKVFFRGFDNDHRITNVTLENIYYNGKPIFDLSVFDCKTNEFADRPAIK